MGGRMGRGTACSLFARKTALSGSAALLLGLWASAAAIAQPAPTPTPISAGPCSGTVTITGPVSPALIQGEAQQIGAIAAVKSESCWIFWLGRHPLKTSF
jgi:hypothetical protein